MSWATAFRSIQEAIDVGVSGDRIFVAEGLYEELLTIADTVALYGGFQAGETDIDGRSWTEHATILDGRGSGPLISISGFTNTTPRVDGFTIRNGSAPMGGGIWCTNASPVIANNTIVSNTAVSVEWNDGNSGAGIFLGGSSAVISNNYFGANVANWGGGGVAAWESSTTIVSNVFENNTARFGGGVRIDYGPSVVSSNRFLGNLAENGGGLEVFSYEAVKVLNNHFVANGGVKGGALSEWGAAPHLIMNNFFIGNTFYAPPPVGLVVKGVGVAIMSSRNGSAVLINNTILGSTSDSAAVTVSNENAVAVNNIIAFNSVGIEASSFLTFRNNCVYGNGSNLFPGLPDLIGLDGNIDSDPLLANPAEDFHLAELSPCIDAGESASASPASADLDGEVRVFGESVDVGADEWNSFIPFALTLLSDRMTPGLALRLDGGAGETYVFEQGTDLLAMEAFSTNLAAESTLVINLSAQEFTNSYFRARLERDPK